MNTATRACEPIQRLDLNTLTNRAAIVEIARTLRRFPGQMVVGMGNEPRRASDVAEQLERFVSRRDYYQMWE